MKKLNLIIALLMTFMILVAACASDEGEPVAPTISSIEATYTQGSTVVYTSDTLSSTKITDNLTVTAHYTDGTTQPVEGSDYKLSGSLKAGTATITVKLSSDTTKNTTFSVTVTAVEIVSISAAFSQGNSKVFTTDTLNSQRIKDILIVTAHYNDGNNEVLSPSQYQLSGTLNAGNNTITVKLNDDSAITDTFTVAVTAVAITELQAVFESGVTVRTDTTLNELKNSLTVTIIYNDGNQAKLNPANYSLSGALTLGISTITVALTQDPTQTTTFTVSVVGEGVVTVSESLTKNNGDTLKVQGIVIAFGSQVLEGLGSGTTAGAQQGLVLTDGVNIIKVSDLGEAYRETTTKYKKYTLSNGQQQKELAVGDEILLQDVKLVKSSNNVGLQFEGSSTAVLMGEDRLNKASLQLEATEVIENDGDLAAFAQKYNSVNSLGGKLIKFVGTMDSPFYVGGSSSDLDKTNFKLHYKIDNTITQNSAVQYSGRNIVFKARANEFNMGEQFWNSRFSMGLESGTGVVAPSDTIPATKWGYTGEIYGILFTVTGSYYHIALIDYNTEITPIKFELHKVMKYDMDQRHELTYYIFDTGNPGLNVAVIGGVHGNEVAGWGAALDMVKTFDYTKGKFLILPKANKLACDLNDRYPGAKSPGIRDPQTNNYTSAMGYTDMNRAFPGNASGTITQQIASVITDILDAFQPQLIFDLHESQNTYNGSGQLGNSIIAMLPYRDANDAAVAAINASDLVLLDPATNPTLSRKNFVSLNSSTAGMVSTTFAPRFSAPTFTLETTRHEGINPEITVTLSKRIEQQRFLIDFLLNYYNTL